MDNTKSLDPDLVQVIVLEIIIMWLIFLQSFIFVISEDMCCHEALQLLAALALFGQCLYATAWLRINNHMVQEHHQLTLVVLIALGMINFIFLILFGICTLSKTPEQKRMHTILIFMELVGVKSVPSTKEQHTEECAICLNEFSNREKRFVLNKCKHMYHDACLHSFWATSWPVATCPYCRYNY